MDWDHDYNERYFGLLLRSSGDEPGEPPSGLRRGNLFEARRVQEESVWGGGGGGEVHQSKAGFSIIHFLCEPQVSVGSRR